MPTVMTWLLHPGMPLVEVICSTTNKAAEAIGWHDRIGTLGIGRITQTRSFSNQAAIETRKPWWSWLVVRDESLVKRWAHMSQSSLGAQLQKGEERGSLGEQDALCL
jgi:hypothetical protein